MDKEVKEYITKEKAKSELHLKAAKDFQKLGKVIGSCVTIEQLDNAKNMSDLYVKKWKEIMEVSSVIHILLDNQRNKIRGQ